MKQLIVAVLLVFVSGGCSIMTTVKGVNEYRIAYPAVNTAAAPGNCAPYLLKVNYVRSSELLKSQRIYYVQTPGNTQNAFTQSRWVQSPAKRIEELVEQTVSGSGIFNNVVHFDSMARGDLLLETTLIDFTHYFDVNDTPSVRFMAHVALLKQPQMQIVATKRYDWTLPNASADAEGGVTALNTLCERFLQENIEWLEGVCHDVIPSRK